MKRDAHRNALARAHVAQHQVHIQNTARAILVMLAFGHGDRLVFLTGFKIDVRFAGVLPGLGAQAHGCAFADDRARQAWFDVCHRRSSSKALLRA